MQQVDSLDKDFQIDFLDVKRHQDTITSDCIQCWDSMSGTLPPFKTFVTMYMRDRMKRWFRLARWN